MDYEDDKINHTVIFTYAYDEYFFSRLIVIMR